MRRGWGLQVGIAGLALVASGCSGASVADRADQVRDAAASAAADRVRQVRDELGDQVADRFGQALEVWDGGVDVDSVCEVVRDRRLSPAERRSLEFVVEYGDMVGVPFPLRVAAERVIELNDNATRKQVNTMIRACKQLGARAMPDQLPAGGG